MKADDNATADSLYQIRPEYIGDVPQSRFRIKAGRTLSASKWHAAFSADGSLNMGEVLNSIQRGGIHPSIRGEVWEFLLGCYDPKSTFEERGQLRQQRRIQYSRWKDECRNIFPVIGSGRYITSPMVTENGKPIHNPIELMESNPGKGPLLPPENNNSQNGDATTRTYSSEWFKSPLDKKVLQWMLTLHQIGLDVVRTDRTLVFFEKEENLAKLWDILSVYAWIDNDVGYGQGMSELCSPMIIILNDEADAFWCFECLMRRLRGNFRCNGSYVGVEAQLSNLAAITQVLDPKLHHHLENLGGGNYLFAFRMLMVLFRREFSFPDSLYLWEMMWALEFNPDLFSMYEEPLAASQKIEGSKGRVNSLRQYGKYERDNMKYGAKVLEGPLPFSVFLVVSILKDISTKLQQEARGLDDIVKILNDITGHVDAKKACSGAIKLHKKYLKKVNGKNGVRGCGCLTG